MSVINPFNGTGAGGVSHFVKQKKPPPWLTRLPHRLSHSQQPKIHPY
jgi:hypothetical protein